MLICLHRPDVYSYLNIYESQSKWKQLILWLLSFPEVDNKNNYNGQSNIIMLHDIRLSSVYSSHPLSHVVAGGVCGTRVIVLRKTSDNCAVTQ